MSHADFMSCRNYIFARLLTAMDHRNTADLAWIDDERLAVVVAANEWALAHGLERRVTVDDVERIEVMAVGHVDYASKLALFVAEWMVTA